MSRPPPFEHAAILGMLTPHILCTLIVQRRADTPLNVAAYCGEDECLTLLIYAYAARADHPVEVRLRPSLALLGGGVLFLANICVVASSASIPSFSPWRLVSNSNAFSLRTRSNREMPWPRRFEGLLQGGGKLSTVQRLIDHGVDVEIAVYTRGVRTRCSDARTPAGAMRCLL